MNTKEQVGKMTAAQVEEMLRACLEEVGDDIIVRVLGETLTEDMKQDLIEEWEEA